jgi:hypothetical protein
MNEIQVKADLIGLREIELLVPAAGPGASEVLHLLRPAASKLQPQSASPPAAATPQPSKSRRKMSILASASFSKSAATLEAAAAAVFGDSEQAISTTTSKAAEALFGFSCIISARGEVKIVPRQWIFRLK